MAHTIICGSTTAKILLIQKMVLTHRTLREPGDRQNGEIRSTLELIGR